MARTTKTPQEMVQTLEAKLAAAKAKEARTVAEGNPVIAKLLSYRESIQKDLTVNGRELNGPQSYKNRRKGFELRLAEINAGEAMAQAQNVEYMAQRAYLDNAIAGMSTTIANGGNVSPDEVQTVLDNLPSDSMLPSLIANFNHAHDARKSFTKERSNTSEPQNAIAIAD